MDLQRAETLLRKINMLFESLQADDEVSAIERDLMREHLRRLYDTFTDDSAAPTTSQGSRAPRATAPPQVEVIKKRKAPARPAPAAPEPPRPEPTPEAEYTPPRLIELDEELQHIAEQPAPPPAPKPRPRATDERPVAPAPPPATELSEEVEALFDLPKSGDVAGRLGSAPIKDLNRAIGINERFLTRDELFGGSDQAMKEALQVLNGLPDFAAAKRWLATHVIDRYGWTDKDRRKKAQVFLKLVRRRYA